MKERGHETLINRNSSICFLSIVFSSCSRGFVIGGKVMKNKIIAAKMILEFATRLSQLDSMRSLAAPQRKEQLRLRALRAILKDRVVSK